MYPMLGKGNLSSNMPSGRGCVSSRVRVPEFGVFLCSASFFQVAKGTDGHKSVRPFWCWVIISGSPQQLVYVCLCQQEGVLNSSKVEIQLPVFVLSPLRSSVHLVWEVSTFHEESVVSNVGVECGSYGVGRYVKTA